MAAIRVDSLRLKFQRIDPTTRTPVTVTVPENGETVETDIPLVADHGILATAHSLSGGIDADGKPELTLEGTYPTLAFDESATGRYCCGSPMPRRTPIPKTHGYTAAARGTIPPTALQAITFACMRRDGTTRSPQPTATT